MVNELERRATADLGLDGHTLRGRAIVFDVRSRDLGGFVEVVRPQAVDRALRAGADIVGLFNHDAGAVLGRTPQTLRLTKDARGLAFELDPPPTQAGRDALALVQRGDVAGASFGFRTLTDAWHEDGGLIVRELLDIDIAEISLTAFPAYQQTNVTVAQRSLLAFRAERQGKSIAWLRMRTRSG
jgi:HK97 family phage prohead protease